MSAQLPLSCTCGAVRGVALELSPKTGNRLTCMCDDCQAYAHHLGRAEEMLDPWGGTEVFQITPAQVRIDSGHPHLRCVRLSDKGLMRWYASCCNTPIANTLASARIPFASVVQPFMTDGENGSAREQVLGPILVRAWGKYGKGELPADAHQTGPLWIVLRAIRLLAGAWIRRKHRPSPFFDAQTGEPVVEPTVLPTPERAALRTRVGC